MGRRKGSSKDSGSSRNLAAQLTLASLAGQHSLVFLDTPLLFPYFPLTINLRLTAQQRGRMLSHME